MILQTIILVLLGLWAATLVLLLMLCATPVGPYLARRWPKTFRHPTVPDADAPDTERNR